MHMKARLHSKKASHFNSLATHIIFCRKSVDNNALFASGRLLFINDKSLEYSFLLILSIRQ